MPTFEVTAPDGHTYEVQAPEGATEEQVLAYAKGHFPQIETAAKSVSFPEAGAIATGGWLDRSAAGLRQATLPSTDYGTGKEPPWQRYGVEAAITGLGNLLAKTPYIGGAFAGQLPSIDPRVQAQNWAAIDQLRKEQPLATFAGEALPYFAAPTPAGAALLAGTEFGAPAERGVRAGGTYLAAKAGEAAANWIGSKLARPRQELPTPKTPREVTILRGNQAGLVLPPNQINPTDPGFTNNITTAISGKIQTAQAAALHNQQVVPELMRVELQAPELGIKPPPELSQAAFDGIRAAAYAKGYEPAKAIGKVDLGENFANDFGAVISDYLQTAPETEIRIPEVERLIKNYAGRESTTAKAIISANRQLRKHGFANVFSSDPIRSDLGHIQLGLQDALENALDRQAQISGTPEIVPNLRAARVLIAKSHTMENAFEESTGNFVASKIAKEFRSGKLTGNLETVGRFAQALPKAMQKIKSAPPGTSVFDVGWGAAAALLSGHPEALAAPLARPAVRSGILSAPYQRWVIGGGSLLPRISPSSASLLGQLGAPAGLGVGLLGRQLTTSGQ